MMRSGFLTYPTVASLLFSVLSFSPAWLSAAEPSVIEQGKQIAFDQKKGNCLACHQIEDGVSPGNVGPALSGMHKRFPTKAALHTQIYDATVNNSHSMMPPFGKHGILTPEELDKVVEYIYTL